MDIVRKYWVATMVLLLVVIHAVIIGYIRSEAKQVKFTASYEIPVGVFYVPTADKQRLVQLRVHVLVDPDLRLSSKATMEMHRWLVHEVVEERLRQLDPTLLADPALLEVKTQIKAVLEDTLEENLIDRVVINDRLELPVDRFQVKPAYDALATEPIYAGKPVFQEIKPSDEIEAD
jgi:hypothetical protein